MLGLVGSASHRREAEHQRPIRARNAEHFADGGAGNLGGYRGDEIALAEDQHLIKHLGDHRANTILQRPNRARSEALIDDLANLAMSRRVSRDETSPRRRGLQAFAGHRYRPIGRLAREARIKNDAIGGTETDRISIDGLRIAIFRDGPEAVGRAVARASRPAHRPAAASMRVRITMNEKIQIGEIYFGKFHDDNLRLSRECTREAQQGLNADGGVFFYRRSARA